MKFVHAIKHFPGWLLGRGLCCLQGVRFGRDLRTYGLPVIARHRDASIVLGQGVVLNSDPQVNLAGIIRPVTLAAPVAGSEIRIGDHTGLSGVVIYAVRSVQIGSYVNIGANVTIYDTDFHPLEWRARRNNDLSVVKSAPVVIEDDVWIGGNAIILKGVHIGRGAVIGAGSVVTHDIPSAEVWAGNPARMIRKLQL